MGALLTRPILSLILGCLMAIVGAYLDNDMLIGAGIGLAGGGAVNVQQKKR